MRHYEYSEAADLDRLVEDLAAATYEQKAWIVVETLAAGLMRAPLHFRIWAWIARSLDTLLNLDAARLSRTEHLIDVLTHAGSHEILQTMWSQTLHWLRRGLDTTDHNSAGGWSAHELALFLKICRRAGWQPVDAPVDALKPERTAPDWCI